MGINLRTRSIDRFHQPPSPPFLFFPLCHEGEIEHRNRKPFHYSLQLFLLLTMEEKRQIINAAYCYLNSQRTYSKHPPLIGPFSSLPAYFLPSHSLSFFWKNDMKEMHTNFPGKLPPYMTLIYVAKFSAARSLDVQSYSNVRPSLLSS